MMGVKQKYKNLINCDELQYDEAQSNFVNTLFEIESKLKHKFRYPKFIYKILSKILFFTNKFDFQTQGLYVHGDVGRGKTFLLTLFLDQFDSAHVRKQHFRVFMLALHKLIAIKRKGNVNDDNILRSVIIDITSDYKIFFVDELFIKNVADAMLVERIFKIMSSLGVFVIFSSNRAPEQLYLNGLQRQRFLPFVEMVKNHYIIYNLDHQFDYRSKDVQQFQNKVFVGDKFERDSYVEDLKKTLAIQHLYTTKIKIEDNREIKIDLTHGQIAIIGFDDLCKTPRSAKDYFAICSKFELIIITDVPKLDDNMQHQVLRFISFIDCANDLGTSLVLTMEVELNQLYRDFRHEFEFQRTISRIFS